MKGNSPGNIINDYPQRGPIKQFRFDKAIAFTCFRCGQEKKSKLITIYESDWNMRLCNGCYGRLLSIYDIKAGTKPEDERVQDLSNLLLSLVSEDNVRLTTERLKIKENRFDYLEPMTIRFLASAEYIAEKLEEDYSLDWSPVIIGLCKAFENELVEKIIRPLKDFCKGMDVTDDLLDKDIGRMAKYIASPGSKEPELGVFGYFLQTSMNSKSRRETSSIIKGFYDFLSNYHHSNWILDPKGLVDSIFALTKNFRNKAAHIEELNKDDFQNCKDQLIGNEGILWKLNQAIK